MDLPMIMTVREMLIRQVPVNAVIEYFVCAMAAKAGCCSKVLQTSFSWLLLTTFRKVWRSCRACLVPRDFFVTALQDFGATSPEPFLLRLSMSAVCFNRASYTIIIKKCAIYIRRINKMV